MCGHYTIVTKKEDVKTGDPYSSSKMLEKFSQRTFVSGYQQVRVALQKFFIFKKVQAQIFCGLSKKKNTPDFFSGKRRPKII